MLGDPPSETEIEAVEFEALKLQRKLDHRKKRKREQRRGVTVLGVSILPSDLVPLMLATLSGRPTVNWRDRKAGYIEDQPDRGAGSRAGRPREPIRRRGGQLVRDRGGRDRGRSPSTTNPASQEGSGNQGQPCNRLT